VTEPSSVVPIAPGADHLPAAFTDAAGDLQQAARAVGRIPGDEHDITAILQATIVCTGQSALEAFEAVVAFVERAPRAEVHSVAWAQSPGGYQATLTVSYADLQGETTGVTHQQTRRS
jgi:hypothetical protein